MSALKSLAVFLVVVTTISAIPIPDNFKRCPRNKNPESSACMKEAIQDALLKIKDGNRKLGLYPLEPLSIENVLIDQGKPSNPINLQLTFNKLQMFGLSQSKVLDVNITVDGKNDYFFIEANTPEIILKANYKVTGQVLLLPITGEGPSTIWIKNMRTNQSFEGVEVENKGQTHIRYDKYKVELHPESIKFDLQNLFDGNTQLGDNMNKVFNENANEIFGELKEPLEEAFSIVFKTMVNKLFQKVSLKEMYIY